MEWLQSLSQGLSFFELSSLISILVLARVAAMITVFPLLGGPSVPIRARALLVLALTLLMLPLQLKSDLPAPNNLVDLFILLAGESTIGLAVGLSLSILFAGIQIAGQVVSQMAGLSLSEVLNPGFDDNVPIYSLFLYMLTTAVFFTLGGHVIAFEALAKTFVSIPVGHAQPSTIQGLAELVASLVGESFVLGIRAGAPAIAALLLATIVLGLIGRTMPQFNAFALGFSINVLVTLGTLSVTMGAVVWIFQQEITPVLNLVLQAL